MICTAEEQLKLDSTVSHIIMGMLHPETLARSPVFENCNIDKTDKTDE